MVTWQPGSQKVKKIQQRRIWPAPCAFSSNVQVVFILQVILNFQVIFIIEIVFIFVVVLIFEDVSIFEVVFIFVVVLIFEVVFIKRSSAFWGRLLNLLNE